MANRSASAAQPEGAPGTVTLRGPNSSGSASPGSAGARPLAFRPTGRWPSRSTIANRSPPTPHWLGSVTASTPAAASAASIALPPADSASAAASAASGWLVATMPAADTAEGRLGVDVQVIARQSRSLLQGMRRPPSDPKL